MNRIIKIIVVSRHPDARDTQVLIVEESGGEYSVRDESRDCQLTATDRINVVGNISITVEAP